MPGPMPAQAQAGGVTGRVRSLDFVEAPIADVVKAISIASGANVVVTTGVPKTPVTLRLTNVTLQEALERAAVAVGADVIQIGNTWYLGTTQELRALVARTGVTRTYMAQNLTPTQIAALIQGTFPFVTAVPLGAPSQAVLVTGRPADVEAALALARQTDLPIPLPPPVR